MRSKFRRRRDSSRSSILSHSDADSLPIRRPVRTTKAKASRFAKTKKPRAKLTRRGRRSSSDHPFSEEWQKTPRRQRRFTPHSLQHLHPPPTLHEHFSKEREKRLAEMADSLEEMEDFIAQYKLQKENENEESDEEEKETDKTKALRKRLLQKFPKPGSKPKVTFKPDQFLIKSGWLYKKGVRRTAWKKRFFRLFLDDPHGLYYYKTPQEAERDRRQQKGDRKGKRVNLLFASANTEKYRRGFHKDKRIIPEFEFYIQTKTLKKVNVSIETDKSGNEVEKEKVRTIYGRKWKLCARSESEKDYWLKTLNYVENQTDACVKEHKAQIQKGLDLKKGKVHKENEIEQGDDLDDRKRFERAQMVCAYGAGLLQGVAGQKCMFYVEDLLSQGIGGSLTDGLSVVVETKELHYDLESEDLGDGKYLVEFMPTRKGEYELTISLDGQDIYGSPFKLTVDSGGICAPSCVARGTGSVLAQTVPNSFYVVLKNQFDERVDARGESLSEMSQKYGLKIWTQGPLVLKKVTEGADENGWNYVHVQEDGSLLVEYALQLEGLDLPNQTLRSNVQGVNGLEDLGCEINVEIDDGLNTPSFFRHISNSPLRPNVILPNTPLIQNQPQLTSPLPQPEQQEYYTQQQYQPTQQQPSVTQIETTYNEESFLPLPTNIPSANAPQVDVYRGSSFQTSGNSQFGGLATPFQSAFNSPYQEMKQPDVGSYVSQSKASSRRRGNSDASSLSSISDISGLTGGVSQFATPVKSARPILGKKKQIIDDLAELLPVFKQPKYLQSLNLILKTFTTHENVGFMDMWIMYDVVPTFVSKSELVTMFHMLDEVNKTVELSDFDWFAMMLIQISLEALGKPMFAQLYNTKKSKINVLLNTWGFGDIERIKQFRNKLKIA